MLIDYLREEVEGLIYRRIEIIFLCLIGIWLWISVYFPRIWLITNNNKHKSNDLKNHLV